MTADEAADIIRALADSLQQHPTQFTFTVNVIGQQAIAHGGGIGLLASAVGGAPSSTTIGNVASASVGPNTIEIAHARTITSN